MRILWPLLLVLLLLVPSVLGGEILFCLFGAVFGFLTIFLVYWQCPRCERLFCFSFPFAWPYSNHCLHCGSRLQKRAIHPQHS